MAEPPHKKPIIGLVGGIGSGKSLVARLLGRLSCGVIDSDKLAQEALDEPAVREQLAAWWGPGVLGAERRVDRRAISRKVFGQPEQLARLEGLIHPQVHERRYQMRALFAADPAVVAIVEDMPLLMEKGFDRECDAIVLVQAPLAARLARVQQARGWDPAELARREQSQWALDIKARRADYVVPNDAGEAECLAHVRRVLSQILERRP